MIDLDELATLLREAGVASDLAVAVETLTGAVANRRSLAAAVETAWNRVFAEAHDRWSNASQPLVTWLEELASQGMLKRLAAGDPVRGSELLAEIAVVAATLPVRAEPLAGFAARLFGDAHALDAGTVRATLAVRAAARLRIVNAAVETSHQSTVGDPVHVQDFLGLAKDHLLAGQVVGEVGVGFADEAGTAAVGETLLGVVLDRMVFT